MTKQQIAVRLDEGLLKEIDARAKEVGLSRNEWIEKSSKWVIHNLPFGAVGPVRRKAAQDAPHEVAGAYSVDMNLS
jgi:hypothetical protein